MPKEMEKVYDPQKVEDRLYEFWIKEGFFSSKINKKLKPFTIVIPPPNVTGSLHMGHALNNTLQDIIIRFKKLRGFNTLWVPGTDHGGIATQNVVEKLIKSENKTRNELGREKFLERMREWKNSSGDTILRQLRKLGCSLDWSRTRFTMDEVCSNAVLTAFVELFKRGLIYRGKTLVNWCPRCHTALSDIEVEHEEEKGKLWHIRYPLKDGRKNGSAEEFKDFIIVATTRPETMLGDTAVAVNPSDKRYENLVGKKIILPLVGREIPIVSDHIVDQTFGTGAVKVTPAHDKTDYEIALRQNLPRVEVIDFHGKMTKEAGIYASLDIYSARKKVLEDLEAQGFLLETKEHLHAIGRCYRCNTPIEPLMSEQWFLKVEEMSKKAIQVVDKKKVKFIPENWANPYKLWLENLRDWCISRQIWWGHRIPIYYCLSNQDKSKKCPPVASVEKIEKCPNCGGTEIKQDEDVLDTWFSSALWPFSVFGWPKKESKNDIEYYYPTSVLVTGHEILYLWVARMVQMGLEFIKDIPFKEVFIHGIVRDRFGKKMSKSLGNVIDPLGIMEKFGTDALRFALTSNAAPGRDMQLSDDSFLSARNFSNKIWNASRFVLMNAQNYSAKDFENRYKAEELADRWIISEYNSLIKNVTEAYDSYNMDSAARLVYEFFWFKYCDWYIEIAKIRLNGPDEDSKKNVLNILIEILSGILRLLHPIMPFITEEIWGNLAGLIQVSADLKSILLSKWPEPNEKLIQAKILENMGLVQEVVVAVRTIRSEMNILPSKNISVSINVSSDKLKKVLEENRSYLKTLAKAENLEIGSAIKRIPQSAMSALRGIEIFVPLAGLIDLEKEKSRLQKEIETTKIELDRCRQKLENDDFTKHAPEKEVSKIKERLRDAEEKIRHLTENIKSMS
ncbi:MAG: valine--tRNA ligase [Elusimicrobia bacterium]|nr:valine--tRNA ligase [Elusimicrobiota bacterium]